MKKVLFRSIFWLIFFSIGYAVYHFGTRIPRDKKGSVVFIYDHKNAPVKLDTYDKSIDADDEIVKKQIAYRAKLYQYLKSKKIQYRVIDIETISGEDKFSKAVKKYGWASKEYLHPTILVGKNLESHPKMIWISRRYLFTGRENMKKSGDDNKDDGSGALITLVKLITDLLS